MVTSKKIWYSFILLFLPHISLAGTDDCPSSTCKNDGPNIRFPFRLKDRQPENCGYPGFELTCSKNNETVLDLPFSGRFFVSYIDYKSQYIEIKDPNRCLHRRLLDFNISDSPFERNRQDVSYNVFNCSWTPLKFATVSCLSSNSNSTYRVISYPSDSSAGGDFEPGTCKSLGAVLVSETYVRRNYPKELNSLFLNWDKPKCGKCESEGRKCGFQNYTTSLAIRCLGKGEFGEKTIKNIAIGVSLGIFVFLVVSMIIVIRAYKQRDTTEKEKQLNIEKFLENYKSLTPTRYSYADIKRITNKFNSKLGQGGYGSVYEGKLTNGVPVAVKILNKSEGNGEEFINEVGTIGRIHHINVVQLLGFCADGTERALIYEFMPNQSLDKFIFSGKDRNPYLGWEKLQDIAIGIARGIEYLHQGCDQRILHFDIKPHNILLDNNFNPKISDFGLAKLSSKGESIVSMTAARGTMGYIAPEVFSRNFGNVSCKSDIYSFGMLLLEIVGGRKNTEVKVEKASQVYFPEWIYYRLDKGEDLGIQAETEEDATIAKNLTMVALWCVQWHPVNRPSMKSVIQMLEGKFENLIMPPNPFASTSPMTSTTTNIPEITAQTELAVTQ